MAMGKEKKESPVFTVIRVALSAHFKLSVIPCGVAARRARAVAKLNFKGSRFRLQCDREFHLEAFVLFVPIYFTVELDQVRHRRQRNYLKAQSEGCRQA